MQLQLSTWQDVEEYLTRHKTILLPVGSTEQHGPTGLIGTDALCPEALTKAAGDQTGLMVAPTFAVGMAQHHMGFAGTITLRPSTIIAMLLDVVGSLAKHGFRNFYVLNGHGGNMATLSAAFSEIYAQTSLLVAPQAGADNEGPKVRCKQRNWWDGKRFRNLSAKLYGRSEGAHATCSEISLTQFLHPDHIKQAVLDPETAPYGPIFDAQDFRRRFPDGRMGSKPSLCSPEHGEQIFHAALEDLLEDLENSFVS